MTFNEVLLLQCLHIENDKIIKVEEEETLAQCKYMLGPCVTVPTEKSLGNIIS